MICAACLPSVDNCELSRPDVILNASRINGNAVMTLRKPVTLSKQKTSFNKNKQMSLSLSKKHTTTLNNLNHHLRLFPR